VTFDTTRADHLGSLGWPQAHTPVLDGLAKNGVLFEQCIAAAPITLPSHASILTGLYPYHHGARNNGTHHVPAEVPTLAETLQRAGFETGAVVSAVVLDSRFGLDQGFTDYDDDLSSAKSSEEFVYRQVDAADTSARALRWLERRGEKRWFLWVHFFDPHADYSPPERFRELCKGSAYDGEIAYADEELGRILDFLRLHGELDSTLVAMTADHGESLGEHGEQTHSLFVYDATTRVPLILAHPSFVQGKRVREVVSSVDIVPTLLELLDLAPSGPLDGRSLAPALRGASAEVEAAHAYSEALAPLFNHGWSDLRAIRDDGGRYIRAPRPELYDLAQDPAETRNLLPGAASRAEPYGKVLEGMLPAKEADAQGSDLASSDADLRRSLDALGYGGSGEGGSLEDAADRPDPKDKVGEWEDTLLGWAMVRAGMHERSLESFSRVIAKDPTSVSARQGKATALRDLGRNEEALVELRALVALPGAGARSSVLLGEVMKKLGQDWKPALARAKELDPRDTMPWTREGDWSVESGDLEAGALAYHKALELDDRDSDAWLGLANVEHKNGREQEAEADLRRAVDADPLSSNAWCSLGVQCEVLARPDEALEHYARAAELDPKDPAPLLKMGSIHLRAGELAPARAAFEAALALDPAGFAANYTLGQIDFQEAKFTAAAERFAAACSADPQHAEAWRKRMMACRSAKDLPATSEAAEHLLALLPDDVQGLMTSAVVLAAQGQAELARSRLERAVKLDPERVQARAKQDVELAGLLARFEQH
jgi:arylsulfatase A-like enzyme/Flp pilus assembly protein TadD